MLMHSLKTIIFFIKKIIRCSPSGYAKFHSWINFARKKIIWVVNKNCEEKYNWQIANSSFKMHTFSQTKYCLYTVVREYFNLIFYMHSTILSGLSSN